MRFTILIAVHNTAKYIDQTLESLLGQTFGDFEAICIDDASTDDSWEVLQAYAGRDARIRTLRLTENVGAGGARNAGLAIARGEYITMLDSDDWYEADTLERIDRSLSEHPGADCAVMRLMMYYEDADGQALRTEEYPTPYPTGCVIEGFEAFRESLDWDLHGLYFVRAEIHKHYPYDTSARLYADDNTTHLHYLHCRSVVISDATYCYRRHEGSMTGHFGMQTFDRLDADASLCRHVADEIRDGIISKSEAPAIRQICETRRWRNIVDAYWMLNKHRKTMSAAAVSEVHHRIAKAVHEVDFGYVERSWRTRPGYLATHIYALFRLQAELYFALRRLAGR